MKTTSATTASVVVIVSSPARTRPNSVVAESRIAWSAGVAGWTRKRRK
jgi:hypothetical protein